MQGRGRLAGLGLALTIGLAALASNTPLRADPPGGFKHDKGGDRDRGDERRGERERFDFHDRDRSAVHDYFAEDERRGRCPPGLAKKHNGCMPPGQAKRWSVGAPLPPDVTYYSLPPALVVQLTPPPVGYRYVRIASDILMIAAGSRMVAAAIEDLGR
jgi:Ni/Co efflux regulator RcnB